MCKIKIEYIYIVSFNDKVSSDAYATDVQAIEFIKSRSNNPKPKDSRDLWRWEDDNNNTYNINCVTVKNYI